jgi:hypothetical protein
MRPSVRQVFSASVDGVELADIVVELADIAVAHWHLILVLVLILKLGVCAGWSFLPWLCEIYFYIIFQICI